MSTCLLLSGIRDNHTRGAVGDFLREQVRAGSRLAVVSEFGAEIAVKTALSGGGYAEDGKIRAFPATFRKIPILYPVHPVSGILKNYPLSISVKKCKQCVKKCIDRCS